MSFNSRAHLGHEVVMGGISNAIFNGLIAWLMLRGGPDLGWSGQRSFAIDILATAFLLRFIVAMIVIPLQRRKLNKGELQVIRLEPGIMIQSLVDRFPNTLVKSALLFGLTGLLIIGPITLLGIYAGEIESFSPVVYAVFKGFWAGLMAAAFVVVMVLVALRESVAKSNSS